jgi:pimeloyl-ACP methyl ester carboxylesterase
MPATPTVYKTISVKDLKIFYREAGSPDKPTLLLLHGFPSNSRMFETLIPLLSDRYHCIAPDLPGFGFSEAPPASTFNYSFDHLAEYLKAFTDSLHLTSYHLYLQDYGGPIGFRLILAAPEKVKAIVIQNAVAHEEGLSALWTVRKAFWRDRKTYEEQVRQNFTSLEAAKQRHIGTSPHPERINPDTWNDEYAFLTRPGQDKIQLDLFYDYQTNVASYPKWQAWLKEHQPPLLVVWGKYDPSFTVAGAEAYKRDVPAAEVQILDAGHFALDEAAPEIAGSIRNFLQKQ